MKLAAAAARVLLDLPRRRNKRFPSHLLVVGCEIEEHLCLRWNSSS